MSLSVSLPTGIDWSVRICELDGTVLADNHADAQLRTASVGKIFLLAEVARRISDGTLDPRTRLSPESQDRVADSGLLHLLTGQDLTVADLCVLVGAVSDNMATNILLRHIGLGEVGVATRNLGFERSALHDFVRDERGPQHPPTLSTGTAAELVDFCARVQCGTLHGAEVSHRLRAWLAADADLSMVAGAFGLDPLAHDFADRGIELWNKTGTIENARIDVGCVRRIEVGSGSERTVVYAVLANWDDAPGKPDQRDRVLAAMRDIGQRIRAYLG